MIHLNSTPFIANPKQITNHPLIPKLTPPPNNRTSPKSPLIHRTCVPDKPTAGLNRLAQRRRGTAVAYARRRCRGRGALKRGAESRRVLGTPGHVNRGRRPFKRPQLPRCGGRNWPRVARKHGVGRTRTWARPGCAPPRRRPRSGFARLGSAALRRDGFFPTRAPRRCADKRRERDAGDITEAGRVENGRGEGDRGDVGLKCLG